MQSFLTAYIHEIISNIPNNYEDNYDFDRFGPQPSEKRRLSWENPLKNYLRSKGYINANQWSDGIMKAVQVVDLNLTRFVWLYNILADDESKEILVKILAFRVLGHRKVKLPLRTKTYWEDIKYYDRLANKTDYITIKFFNWQLYLMDLKEIGIPLKLYHSPKGIYHLFVLEQYRCKTAGIDIVVNPGDYVIDAGACWGDTALYFAHLSRPAGEIFCYEFVPDNLEIFQRNLLLNPHLSERIHLIKRAAWAESNMQVAIHGHGPGTSVEIGEPKMSDVENLTLSIDDLVNIQDLPRVDFIKMDIEGAELQALRGATKTLLRFKPKLAISVYHRLSDFFDIPEYLDTLDCGYNFFLRHSTIHAEETILFADTKRL